MTVTLKIKRYNPETGGRPRFRSYRVRAEETDRVLDLLMNVKEEQDGTLAFRMSCAHGVCGSDAMLINGVERLACKTLVRDVAAEGPVITVEPLQCLPVEKDLMVDQAEFFLRYRSVLPYLINQEPPPEKEWVQPPAQRAVIDDATNCILCAACYSACPVLRGENPRFLGPAQIVQAFRFNEDTRDQGFEERLDALDRPGGVWPCRNYVRCTKVCPRGIRVTRYINMTKRRIQAYRQDRGERTSEGP
ncbi:MAG: succinate dehydrogenase iron-sulfur subunit [Spirochaetota bacterium]